MADKTRTVPELFTLVIMNKVSGGLFTNEHVHLSLQLWLKKSLFVEVYEWKVANKWSATKAEE